MVIMGSNIHLYRNIRNFHTCRVILRKMRKFQMPLFAGNAELTRIVK